MNSVSSSSFTPDLLRLVAAAIVNQDFRGLLLADPMSALAMGYSGARFHLEDEEKQLVLSIKAASLADFAAQLLGSSHADRGKNGHQT